MIFDNTIIDLDSVKWQYQKEIKSLREKVASGLSASIIDSLTLKSLKNKVQEKANDDNNLLGISIVDILKKTII